MLLSTLSRLRCPACVGELSLNSKKKKSSEVTSGTLTCKKCAATYPILGGVAVLVTDLDRYLQFHVKGISALVKDSEIPAQYRMSYLRAKSEIETSATEEDLESQRINALYFMNHYLSTKNKKWWQPTSPEIDYLVKKFWDHGPFAKIAAWTKKLKHRSVIELGCSVGGLARLLKADSYLGVDTAFASIALARHIYLGAPYAPSLGIPQDLYNGPLARKLPLPKLKLKTEIDFVVGELEHPPFGRAQFDLAIVLNAIDMIEDPPLLPILQYNLLKNGGTAIHGCPYIWHKNVAENLRKSLPKRVKSSDLAVEYLFEKSGFKIFKNEKHLPWLFLKHLRQIEMYSVHLFAARKT